MSCLSVRPETFYHVECWRDGRLLWEEQFHNLVTTVGKNKLLDATFKTGEAANQWFVGLVNAAGFSAYAAADTMASHAGWAETGGYAAATRPAFVGGTPSAGSMDNSLSKVSYSMNASLTLQGAFLVDVSTKSGTLGVLYGVGSFTAPRVVISGDSLSVTVTIVVT